MIVFTLDDLLSIVTIAVGIVLVTIAVGILLALVAGCAGGLI